MRSDVSVEHEACSHRQTLASAADARTQRAAASTSSCSRLLRRGGRCRAGGGCRGMRRGAREKQRLHLRRVALHESSHGVHEMPAVRGVHGGCVLRARACASATVLERCVREQGLNEAARHRRV